MKRWSSLLSFSILLWLLLYDGRVFYIILHCLFVLAVLVFFLHAEHRRGLNIYLKASFFFSIKKLMIASSLTWCVVLFSTVIMFYASVSVLCLFVCFKRKQEVSTPRLQQEGITMYIYLKSILLLLYNKNDSFQV